MKLNLAKHECALLFFVAFTSCGARTKSAGDVASMFSGAPQKVGSNVMTLCDTLRQRTAVPNMNLVSLSAQECSDAGEHADEYEKVTDGFSFSNLDQSTSQPKTASGDSVLHVKTRAKIWLNKTILDLASKLSTAMQKKADGKGDLFSGLDPSGSGRADPLAKLIKVSIKELSPFTFDLSSRSFRSELNITGSGVVNIANDIAISGQIIDQAIAISASTTHDSEYAKSLLKNFSALVMVVPFAGDIYVDVVIDVSFYSIGVDGALTSKLGTSLGGALKAGLDGLMVVK